MNAEAVKLEIKKIAREIRIRGWKMNFKPTKKSLKELEALGILDYVQDMDRSQEIIGAILEAAHFAGKKVVKGAFINESGESWVEEDPPSALYLLLHEPELEPEPQPEAEPEIKQVYTITITDDTIKVEPQIQGVEIEAHKDNGEWIICDGDNSERCDRVTLAVACIHGAIGYYADSDYEFEDVWQTPHPMAEIITLPEAAKLAGVTETALRLAVYRHRIYARKAVGTWLLLKRDVLTLFHIPDIH